MTKPEITISAVGGFCSSCNIVDICCDIYKESDHILGQRTGICRVNMCMVIFRAACGSVVVKALCYKPEGRGFDS
jgi:hypothetical protein